MASIAQLVSEMAHAVRQPNNKALRENLKLLIIQTRNELIRRSYENHGYVDKILTQRFKVSLTDVNDGGIIITEDRTIITPTIYPNITVNSNTGFRDNDNTKVMYDGITAFGTYWNEYLYFQTLISPQDWVLRPEGFRPYYVDANIYFVDLKVGDEITVSVTNSTVITNVVNLTITSQDENNIHYKVINSDITCVITVSSRVAEFITNILLKKYTTSTETVTVLDEDIPLIKRTTHKVPRPVRLTNNLPFDRVSSAGFKTNREFPYIKETSARFRSAVPGLCGMPCYDYINEYLYLFPVDHKPIELNSIIIESAFEHPNEISLINGTETPDSVWLDENEYLLSEDMVGQIKDIIYKRDLIDTVRETDEIPNAIKY